MRTFITALFFVSLTFAGGTAFASQCPLLIAQIDQKLEETSLSTDVEEEIQRLRDEGEQAHDEGDHDTAESKLGEALELFAEDAYDIDA